MTINTNML